MYMLEIRYQKYAADAEKKGMKCSSSQVEEWGLKRRNGGTYTTGILYKERRSPCPQFLSTLIIINTWCIV
jgi:hypothetical protein